MELPRFAGSIVEMRVGSHLYGLNTQDSDQDFAGIYIPDLSEVLLNSQQDVVDLSTNTETKNSPEDIDRKFFSLRKFIELCKKGDTNALDMLHADDKNIISSSEAFETIKKNRAKCYTRNMSSMLGYLRAQANKYGVRGSRLSAVNKAIKMCDAITDKKTTLADYWSFLPISEFSWTESIDSESSGIQNFYVVCGRKYQDCMTYGEFGECMNNLRKKYGSRAEQAESNDGVDFKSIVCALRVGYQMIDILTTGTYSYPLAQTEYLKDVRAGRESITDIRKVLERLVDEVLLKIEDSDLPEEPDTKFWDDLYLDICAKEYRITV